MLSPWLQGRSMNPHSPSEISSGVGLFSATHLRYSAYPSLRYLGVGTSPAASLGRSMPVGRPRPSRLAQSWISRPLPGAVGLQAQAVEEHVAGHRQRLAQRQRAVDHAARVLEGDAAHPQRAAVVLHGVRRDQPALQRRHGGDELERGAGGIAALGGAVDQRLAGLLGAEAVVVGRADELGEEVGVERRRAARARAPRRCARSSPRRLRARRRAPSWPARCTSRSTDSRSWRPCAGRRSSSVRRRLPRASTSTRFAPLRPRRKRSYWYSTPDWPTRSPRATPR